MFGIAEILRNLENEHDRDGGWSSKVTGLMPTRDDLQAHGRARSLRGTALGSVLGILPGGGAILASFASYTVEKRLSRHAGAVRQGRDRRRRRRRKRPTMPARRPRSFPMLTLGIPANPVMALMIGAMIIQGITPGPNVATDAAGSCSGASSPRCGSAT